MNTFPILENPRWRTKFKVKDHSWVFVPTTNTVTYGKLVKNSIEEKWKPPQNYYHLRDGGHIRALKSHLQDQYFIHVDIDNFFGNINRSKVTRALKDFFPYDLARRISIDSTVRLPEVSEKKYILPFGFIQSPVIASLCLYKSRLGGYLEHLGYKGIMVSVYMDDIIISGNNKDILTNIIKDIDIIAQKSKLPFNENTEEMPNTRVTAFNINLSNNHLEITNDRMREFAEAFILAENDFQRDGIINYIDSVNSSQINQLYQMIG